MNRRMAEVPGGLGAEHAMAGVNGRVEMNRNPAGPMAPGQRGADANGLAHCLGRGRAPAPGLRAPANYRPISYLLHGPAQILHQIVQATRTCTTRATQRQQPSAGKWT